MPRSETKLTDVGEIHDTISRINELSNTISSKAYELNATDSSENEASKQASEQTSEAVGRIIINRLQNVERILIRTLECLNNFN